MTAIFTEHDRMYHLLTVLQSYAQTGTDREFCTAQVNQLAAEGVSYRGQQLALVYAISDGLRHGNWPWVVRDRAKAHDIEQVNALLTPDQIKQQPEQTPR